MNTIYLYSRNAKKKPIICIVKVTQIDVGFEIQKITGQVDGKLTDQPLITITKGLGKRTVKEQTELKVNSYIKSQKDKGYVGTEIFPLDVKLTDYLNIDIVDKYIPSEKTDASGNKKPQLAFDLNKLKGEYDKKGVHKYSLELSRAFWASYKLDGIRTLADVRDKKLNFKSRTGKAFQGVTKHFEHDTEMIDFCKTYKCEIDGEFYVHGMPLKDINGHCSTQDYDPTRHDQIQFYIFDIALDGMTATERCKLLNTIEFSNPRVHVLKHTHLIGEVQCKEFEDAAVKLGYEGGMLRTPTSEYDFGKRTKNLLKLKPFMDDEFLITGISEGLRDEDMCFTLVTKDGVAFKAKPEGTAKEKEEYRNNINDIIGKMGTVKYQYMTPDGKPFIPVFKNIRNDK